VAFGVSKEELKQWRQKADRGEVAFLTHYWYDARFPEYKTVTKAACCDRRTLIQWGRKYGLKPQWIHTDNHYPHYDLIGTTEKEILTAEGQSAKLTKLQQQLGSGQFQ